MGPNLLKQLQFMSFCSFCNVWNFRNTYLVTVLVYLNISYISIYLPYATQSCAALTSSRLVQYPHLQMKRTRCSKWGWFVREITNFTGLNSQLPQETMLCAPNPHREKSPSKEEEPRQMLQQQYTHLRSWCQDRECLHLTSRY